MHPQAARPLHARLLQEQDEPVRRRNERFYHVQNRIGAVFLLALLGLEDEAWGVDDCKVGAEGKLDAHADGLGRYSGVQQLQVVFCALGDQVCDGCLWQDDGTVVCIVFVLQCATCDVRQAGVQRLSVLFALGVLVGELWYHWYYQDSAPYRDRSDTVSDDGRDKIALVNDCTRPAGTCEHAGWELGMHPVLAQRPMRTGDAIVKQEL